MGSVVKKIVDDRPSRIIRMKLLNLCIVVVFLSTVVNGDADQCPLYNIEYQGVDVDYFAGIARWEECGYLCYITSGCHYWTWKTNGDNICFLKQSFQGIDNANDRISGHKDCYH